MFLDHFGLKHLVLSPVSIINFEGSFYFNSVLLHRHRLSTSRPGHASSFSATEVREKA